LACASRPRVPTVVGNRLSIPRITSVDQSRLASGLPATVGSPEAASRRRSARDELAPARLTGECVLAREADLRSVEGVRWRVAR
jgi:hypothetical protein